jgi:hypothetical protein
VLDIPAPGASQAGAHDSAVPQAYRHALVLCRCDQHVVWRGDQLPDDPAALVERLRGA